jgi:hypothetical protein
MRMTQKAKMVRVAWREIPFEPFTVFSSDPRESKTTVLARLARFSVSDVCIPKHSLSGFPYGSLRVKHTNIFLRIELVSQLSAKLLAPPIVQVRGGSSASCE